MSEPIQVYIALGSNLGERAAHFRLAIGAISQLSSAPLQLSSVWESEPVEVDDERWYWNMVLRLETTLPAEPLLRRLLEIEALGGRRRDRADRRRTLDLDLLLYGDRRIDQPDLKVPHPRMWQRGFVLRPLAEIAPALLDDETGRSVEQSIAAIPTGAQLRRVGRLDWRGPGAI